MRDNHITCKRCKKNIVTTNIEAIAELLSDEEDIEINAGGITIIFNFCDACRTKKDPDKPEVSAKQTLVHHVH